MLVQIAPYENRRKSYLAAAPRPKRAPGPGMVWIPGGTFRMGSDHFYPEERPVRDVTVASFWMDAAPVTVTDFATFVDATGYVTTAEREVDQAAYPDADPELLKPHGLVFRQAQGPVSLHDPRQWWRLMPGANWRRPHGTDEKLQNWRRHPVVQVSYEDAAAYAEWKGRSLPTEAEWEFAARGGLDGAVFAWGNQERGPKGQRLANTWQGAFPHENTVDDGFVWTSPVKSFPPNGYGLYDMIGNVWEWTSDAAPSEPPEPKATCCAGEAGAAAVATAVPLRIIKGGSHLCAPNHCFRYRPSARSFQALDTPTSHIGFRCVVRL